MNFLLIPCSLLSLFISANSLSHSTESKPLSRSSEADIFIQQVFAPEAVTNENGKMPVFYAHQWINFLSWGFLVDIGIVVARYGKKYKYWLQFHSILMVLLLVCAITAEFMIHYHFQRPPSRDVPKIKEAHKYIGFTFIGLMLAQLLNGLTLSLLILQPRVFNFLKYVQLPHLFLGTILYLVGKVQVGLGVYIIYYEDRMNIALWSVYGFIFFWRILLETLYRKGILALYLLRTPKDTDERLLKHLDSSYFGSRMVFYINSNNEQDLQTEYGNRLWCIFNNSIVDLTNFVHPGGQFILQAVKGREVSRFIYGAYGLESTQIAPYTHSEFAKELITYFTVGHLNSIPFFYEGEQEITGESVKREIWQNTSQKSITAKTSIMGFTHERLSIRAYLFSINCMGRYFLIKPVNAASIATRPYTMVLSITDESADFRIQLEKFLEHHLSENLGDMKPQLEVPQSRKELPLLIKRYESETGFSQFIHSNPNEMYYIEGPFGTSFNLPNDGTLVMICGGTGIFPLLDLLDYFYKQTIYMFLLEKAGKEVAEQSNLMSYKFNSNLRVLLIFSVFDESELIGQDIYLRMLKLQSKLTHPFFDMILKINQPLPDVRCVKSRFDKVFFEQMLDLPRCSRFLICGPPAMNRDVPLALMQLGVAQDKIHLI